MRRIWNLVVGAVLAAASVWVTASEPIYVLRKDGPAIKLEAVPMEEGAVQVFPGDAAGGYIDVVMPVGPGGSGNLAQLSEGRLLIVRLANGEFRVTERASGGKEYARPARNVSDLRVCDVRVNVTSAAGAKAFLLAGWKEVHEDAVGLVSDLFAGKVPIGANDYLITTDTYRAQSGPAVQGDAALVYSRYLFVKGKLADGREGEFAVDLGAGETIVRKSFLPENTAIEPSAMTQYTGGVKQLLPYEPQGATGKVQTVLGNATLPELTFGALKFRDASVTVLSDLPELGGRRVAGILGLDLLRRAACVRFEYDPNDKTAATLRLGPSAGSGAKAGTDGAAGAGVIETPLAFINSHLVIKAEVNGAPIAFVLDTGAPECFLDGRAADAARVRSDEQAAQKIGGLDKGEARAKPGRIEKLRLGGREFQDIAVFVSDLPVFAQLRVNRQAVGLLGNSFFSRFRWIEIDFNQRVARFAP